MSAFFERFFGDFLQTLHQALLLKKQQKKAGIKIAKINSSELWERALRTAGKPGCANI